MSQKYLYPCRKRVEIVAALYACAFGFYIWAAVLAGDVNPIGWVRQEYELVIAEALICSGIIHGVGVFINGRWRYSPLLRLIGMLGHATVMAGFAVKGGWSSATYTYAWISGVLLYGAIGAATDFLHAMGWKWTKRL